MRNMSFMLTTQQVRDGTKTVTRRLGWWNLKPGDIVMAVVKGQGIKKGEKVERIRPIRIKSTRKEPLNSINLIAFNDGKEVKREGFQMMDSYGFVNMFCKHNKCYPFTPVNRIEFEYV